MKKLICLLVLVMIMSGCVTSRISLLSKIKVGMTRTELTEAIGNPNNISAQGNCEYLTYFKGGSHFVRLIDGKVEAFGKWGDFDSIKPPERKLIIDLESR